MIPDIESPPQRSPRRTGGARPLSAATLRALRHDLFALSSLSARSAPFLPRVRHRVLRKLPFVLAAFFALDLAVPTALAAAERLHLVWAGAAALGCAQALPVVLALRWPLAAWWLSLVAMLPYGIGLAAMGGSAPADAPWPWTETGLIAHLTVTLLVAWRAKPRVYLAQWLLTVLTGGLLTVLLTPVSDDNDLFLLALLSAFGLAVIAVVRGRSEAAHKLREQEVLTEFERTRRALLEERTRIARELHDVVAHHMSVIAVQAEAAPYRVTDPPQELSDSFASIRGNALAALTEMRHILGMLRSEEQPSDGRYTPQPTLENIEELVANVRAAGLRIESVVSGTSRPLPKRVELSAFRIVQEALSNALRHAPGCQVEFELSYGRADVRLRVSNSPATGARRQAGRGHGVLGMRERAATLGGTLRIGPREDGWYEVTATLPTNEGEGV
ncbi:histidine kinase [Streptomyces decoyicus]|uniref:sensor histidine kinase n=1 Tax=Streptomyces decoyicus TaxID=249567 RepID=UPI002E3671A8|nr:histidine kinase [Streptomyces decoyicus]